MGYCRFLILIKQVEVAPHCNTQDTHTATHCNALQHTAIHCSTLQLVARQQNEDYRPDF